MIYLLNDLGAFIWVLVIVKASLEFRYTLQEYNADLYINNSIVKTHQNLSGLIFIIATAISLLMSQMHYRDLLQDLYGSGMWVTALLLRVMLLYQVELYRRTRVQLYTMIDLISLFKINLKKRNEQSVRVV